ncbi:hypothetical protein SK54_01589 [Enterobacter sp. MGH120]|uniref:terminase small subunit n=1 Tax=Enterobacter sp. MGH120 TaxID=1686392 RepID=UPI000658B7B7|nr:terminase small subunit [Enterobacter sp. MGH120]KLW41806.1 hypothetical protein SK54_01589 [Enterobacter sp. MGH120]
MAKPDWGELQQRFLSEHAATGVSPKEWCEAQGLNYATARRYIKKTSAQTAQKSAQKKVRIAQKEQSANELMDDDGLTAQQRLFVAEYLKDGNATQAAIRAGYSKKSAEQIGYQLLQKTSVAQAIAQQQKASIARTLGGADEVLAQMWQLATFDANQPATAVFMGINCAHSSDSSYCFQLGGRGNQGMWWRARESASFLPWLRVYDTGNTTRASDGTLKAASPVVKLYADGSFETNNESEGCTVTRMKAGEYLIEGCMGMNSDAAWGGIDGGFDIPKDRNGQALIWLDYEVNADGSVLVKTFHREYPSAPIFARNSREGFVDGEPADIPADQFVSVRVEMPQNSIWNQRAAMAEVSD